MLLNGNEMNNTSEEKASPTASAGASIPVSEAVDLVVLTSFEILQVEGEPDLVIELIDLYLKDTSAKLIAMQEAIVRTDAISLKQAAHALRGSSSNLGASRMATLCAELEYVDGDGLLERAGEVLTQLEREFEHVMPVFAAERQRRL